MNKENEIGNSDNTEAIIHGLIAVYDAIETEISEKAHPKPKAQKDYTEIERTIASMLQENTGASILDSGFAYGRHWEYNRTIKDFRKLPILETHIDDDGSYWFSLNIFHFLTQTLEINKNTKKLERELYKFEKKYDYYDPWEDIIEDFVDMKVKKHGYKKIGDFFNTYYEENIISQIFQGILFYKEDYYRPYIILMIHNGSDVRGGYTNPKVFQVIDWDLFINAGTNIYAHCDCTNIYSDDAGYHWYLIDYANGNEKELKDLPEYWKVKKGQNGNNKLVCEKCGKDVVFESELELY